MNRFLKILLIFIVNSFFYLNLEILFDYLNEVRKPVVWTLHDCWAFTGKCAHYTDVGCYKWQTQCMKCPQIKKYPPSLVTVGTR